MEIGGSNPLGVAINVEASAPYNGGVFMMKSNAADIDAYLAGLPDDAREALSAVRQTIKGFVPDAVESISYGMPTFKYKGRPLIYFAAAKNHLGLYGTSKGTMRFSPADPPPEAEVQALLRERIEAIEASVAGQKRGKSGAETPG